MDIALAIILEGDKILIGKIKPEKVPEYGGLKYAFPSERIHNKSNIEKELVEEIKRQTNLDIKIIRKIGERAHPSTKNYTYYFHCEKRPQQTLDTRDDIDVEFFIWIEKYDLQTYMPTLFDEVKSFLNK